MSLLIAGCSTSPDGGVEVVDRNNNQHKVTNGYYAVKPGDTLWSIAFRFGWDWRDLAQRNGIVSPYMIYPGQRIRFDERILQNVTGSRPVTSTQPRIQPSLPQAGQPQTGTVPNQVPITVQKPVSQSIAQPVVKAPNPQQPAVVSPSVPATTPISPVTHSASGWAWPASGTVISRFSSNGSLNKGIDIAGQLGESVLAASSGTVVYAGSGLRGYGELVIIKHNDTFVSAYGHNRRLLVREGQQVKTGQTIAEMGSTGADRVKLHFEIRRQGKPIDPLQYLPSR
nr:peptidoglycan DD-metalloendopeptidase family protein [Azomonas macrocytogenes]